MGELGFVSYEIFWSPSCAFYHMNKCDFFKVADSCSSLSQC